MSTFAVTIEEIGKIWEHTNADRLEMAQVTSMSYQFVIAKGSFKLGDLVVYFPIDSILPDWITKVLNLEGKLAGPGRNRVKTVRLRGEISQGIVAEPQLLLERWNKDTEYSIGEDVTELLGVTKYEPPPVVSQAGTLLPLPSLVHVYDIEGAERFSQLIEQLLDKRVLITEKLEGSHFAASIHAEGQINISQRRFRIEPVAGAEHDWHKAARLIGLFEKLPLIQQEIAQLTQAVPQVVTLRGEMIGVGIQGNYYRLPDQRLYIFEMEVDGSPINADKFLHTMSRFEIPTVPILINGETLGAWLQGRSMADASNGYSLVNSQVLREGIVVRPIEEFELPILRRVILKQRSPQYLAGSDF